MIKEKRLSPMPRTKGSKNRPKTNITKKLSGSDPMKYPEIEQ